MNSEDTFDYYADRVLGPVFDWVDEKGVSPYIERFFTWLDEGQNARIVQEILFVSGFWLSTWSYRRQLGKLNLSKAEKKTLMWILTGLTSININQQRFLRNQREFQKTLDQLKLRARKKEGMNGESRA